MIPNVTFHFECRVCCCRSFVHPMPRFICIGSVLQMGSSRKKPTFSNLWATAASADPLYRSSLAARNFADRGPVKGWTIERSRIGDPRSRIQDRGSRIGEATDGGSAIGDRRWEIVGIPLCLLTYILTILTCILTILTYYTYLPDRKALFKLSKVP